MLKSVYLNVPSFESSPASPADRPAFPENHPRPVALPAPPYPPRHGQ